MTAVRTVEIINERGLHARASAKFVKLAAGFEAEVTVSRDGQTVDAEDHLWVAHWDGGRITRFRPDGTVERVVFLPAPRITSCCFGGPDLDVLYVTSARIGMSEAMLRAAPLAGGLFAVTGLGVRGLAPARFAG